MKAGEPDKLWSVADLCASKNGRPGTSIYEISLARDAHSETSLFRIVTLRPVVSELKILTFPRYAPGREVDGERFALLKGELDRRFPEFKSTKNNGSEFWIEKCQWDERHSEEAVRTDNFVRLLKLGIRERRQLLPEHADLLLDELRTRAKIAGSLKWEPHRDKKIISRDDLRHWWETRTQEILVGASSPSGGKLVEKLEEAQLPSDLLALATEMRLHYAAAVRTSRYMERDDEERVQIRVKSELLTLRARFVARQIDGDGIAFHALCLERMDSIAATRTPSFADREESAAYLKGCMYDITDRCLLRFVRPAQ